jgi:glycosyltransferase involved in cell wall biosynthesis
MKLLWVSDSPTVPSGFGNVTRFVCAGLAARGHRVDILGWQHRGGPQPWSGCTIHPVARDGFGADVLPGYLRRLQPDVLVTLADVWWLTWIADPVNRDFLRTAGIPWVLYYPVDADRGQQGLPPSWVQVLQTVDLPVAMSRYGKEVTQANGVRAAHIPHGVDLDIFRPPHDKQQAKRRFGYGGRFVVLSDARNQPRKMLPRTLDIFRRFARGRPDALLHLHCDPHDPAARSETYCYDLSGDLAFLSGRDPDLRDRVRVTGGMAIDHGLPLDRLGALYQAADVHLLCSWGEGFGLPTLQAAAAGVVPVAADYSANRELLLGHGEAVSVRHWLTDEFGLRRALLDVDNAADRIAQLHADPVELAERAAAGVRFAEQYAWPRVVERWDALLTAELPALRHRAGQPQHATELRWGPRTWQPSVAQPLVARPGVGNGPGPGSLGEIVREAVGFLPAEAQVRLTVAESVPGTLTAAVFRDATAQDARLTIPVTLPSPDPTLARWRVPGRVYAATAADVPVVTALARILPGLSVWSSRQLDLGPSEVTGRKVTVEAVAHDHPRRPQLIATTTLALDLAGADPWLPAAAARAAVPCIASGPAARALWPDLTVVTAEDALEVARRILLDQGEAGEACARAAALLAGAGHDLATAGGRS